MRCPKCQERDDKVIDSRAIKDETVIRRRRECLSCEHRFTTYEEIERDDLRVLKRDGRYETFDRKKLVTGIDKACEKRPVSREAIERTVNEMIDELVKAYGDEIPTKAIGDKIMVHLRRLDEVAYVRFASVYRKFRDIKEFVNEVQSLNLEGMMIALPQRLPHVIWKNNRLIPLSEGWLAESIESAAAGAGYHRWHLAPEVARAIAVYLENDWIAPALPLDRLREMVQKSLQGIGFEDIAEKSLIVPPRVSISLMEIAVRAPYEIEFYPLLKERLADALEVQVGGVRLEGLRDCTKVLDSAGRWRTTCVRISDDIIYFCRSYIHRTMPRAVDLVIQ